MDRRIPMRLISTIVFVLGLALVAGTATAPRYDSETWNEGLLDLVPGLDPDAASSRFFAAQAAHRTADSRVQDLGRGVAALGGSLMLVVVLAGARDWSSVRAWRSPRTRWVIAAALAGSWTAMLWAEWWWLEYTMRRGDYPPWADSMGIPAFGLGVMALATAPLIGLLLTISLRRSPLPVAVVELRPSPRFWIVTAGAVLIALLLVGHLARSIQAGAVPSVAATVFALASLCAWWPAAASQRAVDQQPVADGRPAIP